MHPNHPTTLRGVFPDRPVPHRRNFIRENVLRIKTMNQSDMRARSDLNAQVPAKVQVSTSLSKLRMHENCPAKMMATHKQVRRPGIQKLEIRPLEKRSQHISDLVVNNNISHRSMQTNQQTEELGEGVVSYPNSTSPAAGALASQPRKGGRRRDSGHGDSPDDSKAQTPPSGKEQCSDGAQVHLSQQVNYIRNNIKALKGTAAAKKGVPANVLAANGLPPTYKKGVAPKYIKKREPEEVPEQPSDCPPGHVLLPEDERKETLRVLRESYAEKIQELNCMPVRSDTLRMQRRKIELEAELKKIDEGIKIFQRPSVFVKVNV